MKKILCALLAAIMCFVLSFSLFRYWVNVSALGEKAYCLYTSDAADVIDYAGIAGQMNDIGIDTGILKDQADVLSTAEDCLRNGATILVIGLGERPADDSLLKLADEKNADLFFVGEYPGGDYLNSYDKAYYIGSHEQYGGELAGRAAAMIYRNGVIADQTNNALLDYLHIKYETNTEETLLRYSLSECEHYGIYSESALIPHAEAASDASSDAGTSLEKELGLNVGGAAESGTDFVADYSTLSGGAAELRSQWSELEYEPELIYCFSDESLRYAEEYAQASGWLDRASPVQFICFTQGKAEAEAADDGICRTIIYYDTEAVTKCVFQMISNLVQQNNIVEGTGLLLDETDSLWVPYQLYSSAENDTPAPVAEELPAESAADSASAS